jgi:hypothetical protein
MLHSSGRPDKLLLECVSSIRIYLDVGVREASDAGHRAEVLQMLGRVHSGAKGLLT